MTRGRQKKEIENKTKEEKVVKKQDDVRKPTVKKAMKDVKNKTKTETLKTENRRCKPSLKGKIKEK